MHNSVPGPLKAGFRFGWSGAGRRLGRLLARHGRTGPAPIRWRKTGGPWFGNQLMTLTLHGRKAALTLVQAREKATGAQLETVLEQTLTMRRVGNLSAGRQNAELASTGEVTPEACGAGTSHVTREVHNIHRA